MSLRPVCPWRVGARKCSGGAVVNQAPGVGCRAAPRVRRALRILRAKLGLAARAPPAAWDRRGLRERRRLLPRETPRRLPLPGVGRWWQRPQGRTEALDFGGACGAETLPLRLCV